MRKTGAGLLFYAVGVSGLLVSGCAKEVKVDPNEVNPVARGAAVQFDPSRGAIPFPNNLIRNPETGKLALPSQCGESPLQTDARVNGLNTLNGFASLQPAMRITFDKPVDVASLGLGTASQKIKLMKRLTGTTPSDPATAASIPFVVIPGTQKAFSADCKTSVDVPNLTLVASILDSNSTYVVVVLNGIKATDGTEFGATAVWALARQQQNPVTIEQGVITRNATPFDASSAAGRATILGLDLLWKAHARALGFASAALAPSGIKREDINVAFEFTTQDNRTWADPANGLAATAIDPSTGLPVSAEAAVTTVAGGDAALTVEQIFDSASAGLCAQVSCHLTVAEVVSGSFSSPVFQLEDDRAVPSVFADPYHPDVLATRQVKFLGFVPTAPLESFRTVIFAHGFTRKKEDLFAIASQFAAKGIATVAIDWPLHGERALQTIVDESIGCAEGADPTNNLQLQCFAPILSLSLPTTRDNLRQGAVDVQQLAKVLASCGTEHCGSLKVDATKIGFIGQSLGALIGTSVVANTPEIRAAVLNVGGGLLVDVLLNSKKIEVICPVVNGLISAGMLQGVPYPEDGALCLEDSWRTHPATLQFAALARWILDPADGANFARLLAAPTAPRVLLQEVVNDTVVPNVATSNFGTLLGLRPNVAATATAIPTTASPLAGEKAHIFLRYVTEDGVNTFNHGSLLAPADGVPGALGTTQMQTDAITFLDVNL